jgi:NAD(P)-dependent dehydrogenase (short-subunit alcohol dehydrogenase family)
MTKIWFVTGASSGFGRAIAEGVIGQGDRIIATARDPKSLAELVARAPDRVVPLRLDVRQPKQIDAAIAAAGPIDVLVNNAGYSMVGAVEETSDADLRDVMETMFFGAVALTRAVLPMMRERRTGTIVQITSVGGLVTSPGFGPYCAAKHALEALSESLAAEVAPYGIRVLIVEPGAFRTQLFGPAFRTQPPMPAYEATVGPIRAWTVSGNGTQEGDPAKAARAIIETVAAGSPRLRLPLGADAVANIRTKLAVVTADVDASEAIASATAF